MSEKNVEENKAEVPQDPQEAKGVILGSFSKMNPPPLISYGKTERAIIGLLCRGLGFKNISKELKLSSSTIKRVIRRLREKGWKIGLGGECSNMAEMLKGFSSPQETKGVISGSNRIVGYDKRGMGASLQNFLKDVETMPESTTFVSCGTRAHNIKIKYDLVSPFIPSDLENYRKYSLNYNDRYIHKEEFYNIEFTSKSLLIQFKPIQATNAEDIMQVLKAAADEIVKDLQAKYKGLQVSGGVTNGQVISQHHAIVNDPFALWLRSKNISFSDGLFDIDSSTGIGELEFTSTETAQADWTKYNEHIKDIVTSDKQVKLSEMEQRVSNIEANMEKLSSCLVSSVRQQESLMKQLELLVNLEINRMKPKEVETKEWEDKNWFVG
jgi:DNA-binding Lrp family transcriptional regulator